MNGAGELLTMLGSELGVSLQPDRRVMEALAIVMAARPIWGQAQHYVISNALRNISMGYTPRAPVDMQIERVLVDIIAGGSAS
jgi:hypothetical protein